VRMKVITQKMALFILEQYVNVNIVAHGLQLRFQKRIKKKSSPDSASNSQLNFYEKQLYTF